MIRLVIIAVLLAAGPACKRRAPGTCDDHIDCGPGYDCLRGRCTKRAAVGGDPQAPTPPPAPVPQAEPLPPSPSAPPPPEESKPSKRAPKAQPPAPVPASPPPVEREPLWKQRRKNA